MDAYTPPLDLLVLMGFAPYVHDGWRYDLAPDENGPVFLLLTTGSETGITVVSSNYLLDDGSRYKELDYCGQLPDLDTLLQVLTYCHWDFPDAFADEAAFEAHLIEKGFLQASA